MNLGTTQPLALVVRKAPYSQRAARAQLDVALAAATLELPLEIYFLGDGVWQLAEKRHTQPAGLARGLKGWGAISQMTRVSFFSDADCLQRLRKNEIETVVAVEGLDGQAMAERWQSCGQVISV